MISYEMTENGSPSLDPGLQAIAERALELQSRPADDPLVGGEALQLLNELAGRAANPKGLTQFSEQRRALIGYAGKLGRFLIKEMGSLRGDAERGRVWQLLVTFMGIFLPLLTPGDDKIEVWMGDILELSSAIRSFRLRHHLTLAEPIWTTGAVPARPSAVWYAGPSDWRAMSEHACTELGLQVREPFPNDYAQSCWDGIRSSAAAIFGLGGTRRECADTCYQMGIASAVGTSMVILAGKKGEAVPFDVGVQPVVIHDAQSAGPDVRAALERALFDVGFVSAEDQSLETFQRAVLRSRNWFEKDHLQRFVGQLRDQKVSMEDPLHVERALLTLWAGKSRMPIFIRPVWPGRYPSENEQRCFHIMPFGERWSDKIRETVERACRESDVIYDRGDMGEGEPRVLHEIWSKIGSSTHLVVDTTGNNPNVAAELGMAHTLGQRKILVLRQKQVSAQPPNVLRKIRYEEYDPDDQDGLMADLRKFLET